MTYLVTVKKHEHDGRTHKAGDKYRLDDYYARQLIHLGFCIEESPQAEPTPAVAAEEIPKRRYQRRDMVPVK